MASDKFQQRLNEIGQLLAEDAEYPLDGTLLYAFFDANVIGPSIFRDRGNHIVYRSPDLDRLGDALMDLWEAEEPGKRWAEIEYVVHAGKFDVTFIYSDEIDPKEEPLDRRTRIVRKHFGEKPIIYPPWPEEGMDQFEL